MCLCNSIPLNSITPINRTINFILPAGSCVPLKLIPTISETCFNICSTKCDLFQFTLYHKFFKVIFKYHSFSIVPNLFTYTAEYLQYLTVSLMVYYSFSIFFSPVNFVTISTVSYCICDGFSQCLNLSQFLLCMCEMYGCPVQFITRQCPQLLTSHCFSHPTTRTLFLKIYLILSKLYRYFDSLCVTVFTMSTDQIAFSVFKYTRLDLVSSPRSSQGRSGPTSLFLSVFIIWGSSHHNAMGIFTALIHSSFLIG